jgi:hypothetical protein
VTTTGSRSFDLQPGLDRGLVLDRQQWEALPERLADPFFLRIHEHNLEALRRMEESGPPDEATEIPIHMDRPEHRRPGRHRILKNWLLRSIAAWYLTREQAHLDRASAVLDLVCHSTHWQPRPGLFGVRHANLATGELLYMTAFGLDALGPYLDEGLRRRCVEVIRDKGLAGYLSGIEAQDWWYRCDFNWNSAVHANAGTAALAIRREEPELARRVLNETCRGLSYLLPSFHADGGYTEGCMYCDTAIGHLSDFAIPLYRITGEDLGLSEHKGLEETLIWHAWMRGRDGRPINFSNCNEGTHEWGLTQAFWWARRFNRPDIAGLQERILRDWRYLPGLFFDVESFWYREPFQPSEPPRVEGLRHFESLDWLTWHGEKLWMAVRSGFNGGNHNNRDLGHFVLGRDDERFLVDPGYGAGHAEQHNAVTLRHRDQCDGATARLHVVTQTDRDLRLTCDLGEAWPMVTREYRRHYWLVDDEHLLIVDNILGRPGMRTGGKWHLQTRLPVEPTDEGFVIHGREADLRVILLTDADCHEITHWEHRREPVTTLSWRHSFDRENSFHPFLLSFGKPDMSLHQTPSTTEICLEGLTWAFDVAEPYG